MLTRSDAVMPYTNRMISRFEDKGVRVLCLNEAQMGQVGIYTKAGELSDKTRSLIDLITTYSNKADFSALIFLS